MVLETIHNVDKGLTRLLYQPTDLDSLAVPGAFHQQAQASTEHRSIFAGYVLALREVFPVVESWWSSIIDSQLDEGAGSREEALEASFLRRLAGPASDPQFVFVIRDAWLRCDALNRTLSESERVAPQILLLQWLLEAGETDLVRLVTCMPYWPIGLDADGNWC